MIALHEPPGAQRERPAPDGIHTEQFQSRADRDEIDDAVQRADFVEGHVIGWHVVDATFGVGQLLKRGDAGFLDTRTQARLFDQRADFAEAPPQRTCRACARAVRMIMASLRMAMLMSMFVPVLMTGGEVQGGASSFLRVEFLLYHARDFDIEFNGAHRTAEYALGAQLIAGQFELGDFVREARQIDSQVQQRADKHIARNAGEWIEVEDAAGCVVHRLASAWESVVRGRISKAGAEVLVAARGSAAGRDAAFTAEVFAMRE